MSELVGFPMISQRDGNINQNDDCVAASLAACLEWLTGQKFTGGEIKDAVYGSNYVGGTAAISYVEYCAGHGVTLAPVDGNGNQLVQALHSAIEHQTPAIITEPSSVGAGWSHVCAAYKCDSGSVTVMDPWLDAPVTKSDATWAAQLEFNQIWRLEKAMLTINEASGHFTDLGNNVWKCANNNLLGHGMLGYYCRTGSAPLFGLTLFGLPRTNEIGVPGYPGVVLQVFERGVLAYDPGHVLDNPPGSSDVYTMHIDSGPGLAQIAGYLPAPTPQTSPNTATIISELQALQTATNAGLVRVLADLGKS